MAGWQDKLVKCDPLLSFRPNTEQKIMPPVTLVFPVSPWNGLMVDATCTWYIHLLSFAY
jgi:hypothetical protein